MASNSHIQKFDVFAHGLPFAEDAERFAIATAWQHEGRLREYMAMLKTEYFGIERNRELWDVMRNLFDAEIPVTRETVISEIMKTHGNLELIGGTEYVIELSEPMPDVKAEHWVKPILDTFARRRLMLKMNEAMIRLANRGEAASLICQEVEDEARACATVTEVDLGFATLEDVIRQYGSFEAFLARDGGDAVPYPWPSLNRLTNGGMRPGQVIVVAGPSGRGKTALAVNIAYASRHMGKPVMFSLEMPKDEIFSRVVALSSMVDSFRFKKADQAERTRLRDARRQLAEQEFLVDDSDCVTVSAMKSKTKKLMSVEPVSMVLIDYAQLVEAKRGAGDTREQEIAKVMRGLKRMAMQLKIPIVVLSQILEDPGAGTREPELKDLRESRSIGHTADLVAFLHFTRFYDMGAGIPTGDLDLLVKKQRSGPAGKIALTFHAPTGRFYELDSSGREE